MTGSSVLHEELHAPPDLESSGIAAQNRGGACARKGRNHRRNVVLFPQPNPDEGGDDPDPSGSENGVGPLGGLPVFGSNQLSALVGVEGRQGAGNVPDVLTGPNEAEVTDYLVRRPTQAVEHSGPRRDPGNAGLHLLNHGPEDAVDPIKVGLQVGDLVSRNHLDGGNAEVEVDVRVHPEEEVLENERTPALSGFERPRSRAGRPRLRVSLLQRIEVPLRKRDVQSLHPGVVLELPSLDGRSHPCGDVPVEGSEVSVPTLTTARLGDNLVEPGENLIDRWGGMGTRWSGCVEESEKRRPLHSSPRCQSGPYVVRLKAGGTTQTRRVTVVR